MRFFRSTATFRAEVFFERSPMAIAACTQPDSIQEEAALISKDPSLSATGPPHAPLDAGEDAACPARIRTADSPQHYFVLRRRIHLQAHRNKKGV